MGWFKTKIEEETKTKTEDAMKSETQEPEEEWIWVEGYKGTDKDMKCMDFQYELGKQYDMPEDEEIIKCRNGFHLCPNLNDVFGYYHVGNSNRFFKVQALVRKADKEDCEFTSFYGYHMGRDDKLVAKSIVFVSELTQDEILAGTEVETLDQQYKDLAIKDSLDLAISLYRRDILSKDGYSEAFANYVINNHLFDKAHAVGSMPDVSMDMKVLFILQAK